MIKQNILKKAITIFIGILLLQSCNNSEKSIYEGSWIDKKNEMIQVSILFENESYWLKDFNGTYLIQEDEGNYYVSIDAKRFPIAIRKESLYFLKNEFIPESKSLKKQFVGLWKNQTGNLWFHIKNSNGGIIWDIKEGSKTYVSYYPKITKSGFTFTYLNEDILFVLENNTITDSKGGKYTRI